MYHQKYHKFQKLYNHKYGFHINGPNQAAYEAAIRLKPRLLKTLEHDVGAMKRIREAVPDAFFIGRLFDPVQDFGNEPRTDPVAERVRRARQRGTGFAEKILRLEVNNTHQNGRPVFDAWESFNEMFPESVDADTQKVYDEFQVAFGRKMLAARFEPVGMNFATGNFRGWHFVDNFAGTLETYKYLGFHEYDWPRLDRLHLAGLEAAASAENIRDRLAGVGPNQGNDGMWLCLRYRRILHEGVRQKYGDRHVAIITECGMTQGVQQGDDVGPWFKANTLPRHTADAALVGSIDEETYWQQLLWYNGELMRDDYVMGACLFVTGAVGKWWSFEHLGPIMDRLAEFQREVKAGDKAGQVVAGSDMAGLDTVGPAADAGTGPPVTEAPEEAGQVVAGSDMAGLDTVGPAADAGTGPLVTEAPEEAGQMSFTLVPGPGIPLLVGDTGRQDEAVEVIKPNGNREYVRSGFRPGYGPGGFEIYAPDPGFYELSFRGQSFKLPLTGQFTRVIFGPVTGADNTVRVTLRLPADRATYRVGEAVVVEAEVTNGGTEPVPFSILGLLTSAGRFQTSRENGLLPPGDVFRCQDSVTFDTPGSYTVMLSICFAPRDTCLSSDTGWIRFEPGVTVLVG